MQWYHNQIIKLEYPLQSWPVHADNISYMVQIKWILKCESWYFSLLLGKKITLK